MRLLAVGVLVALTAPIHAADKDEDKAKEAAAAFLKAVIAKDIDAVMKTVDVPFMFDMGSEKTKTINKSDELKDAMVEILKKADTNQLKLLEAGTVYDMVGIAKYAKQNLKEAEAKRLIDQAEKLVGKSGCMVMIVVEKDKEEPGLLIRIKDGKALVASVPK
jgi:ketosteroid isomerase-like protein